jgi:putative ABC transport system permease protein
MFVDNIRHTLRGFRVARGFTAAALGSISIGIAANITTFSLVNAILLKPLPYTEPDQLVSVRTVGRDGFILGVLGLHILDWRKNLESIESVEAVYTGIKNMRNLDGPGEPERVGAVRVTAKFFDMLGIKPRMGRWFTRAEEDRLAPDVVVISDALWRRHFSSDPHILGSRILIEGKAHEVIGITPPDMHFFRGHQFDRLRLMPDHADLFTPVRLRPAELAGTEPNPVYAALARLKRGKTINQARTEIDSRMARLRSEHPEFMELHPIVEPLESTLVGDTRQPLVMLLSAVGLVLLVVCVNVANLLLVRGAGRQRELALRTALGARRRHLIAQSLMESLLLAVFGTALGTLLASWMIDTVVLRAPLQWARLENTSLDFNVLLFAIGLCFMTAVLFGALPALRVSQAHPLEALKEGGRGASDSRADGVREVFW